MAVTLPSGNHESTVSLHDDVSLGRERNVERNVRNFPRVVKGARQQLLGPGLHIMSKKTCPFLLLTHYLRKRIDLAWAFSIQKLNRAGGWGGLPSPCYKMFKAKNILKCSPLPHFI